MWPAPSWLALAALAVLASAYQGRPARDPFGSHKARPTRPSDCIGDRGGLRLSDVVLRGVVKSPRGYVALFEETACKTTYQVPATYNRFLDGEIVSIDGGGVTFRKTMEDDTKLKEPRLLRLEVGGAIKDLPR
jgi:hypothetical protein